MHSDGSPLLSKRDNITTMYYPSIGLCNIRATSTEQQSLEPGTIISIYR